MTPSNKKLLTALLAVFIAVPSLLYGLSYISGGISENRKTEPTEEFLPVPLLPDFSPEPVFLADGDLSGPLKINVNTAVKGKLSGAGDEKWYMFDVPKRGCVRLGFSHSTPLGSTSAGWKITLYDGYAVGGADGAVYRELDSFKSFYTDTSDAKGAFTGVLAGRYYVSVKCEGSFFADDYTLTAGFEARNDFEAECNDGMTRYNKINLNKKIYGTTANKEGGDVDFFMFETFENGTAEIVFEHGFVQKSGPVGWIIELWDINKNNYYICRSTHGDTLNKSGPIGLPPGVYFVSVKSQVISTAVYSLTVNFNKRADFEKEPNDTMETASALPLNAVISGTLSARGGKPDKDYFKIELARRGHLTLKFAHESFADTKKGWNVRLLTEKGEVLYQGVSRWSDVEIISPEIGLGAGVYYVLIDSEGVSLNGGVYTVTNKFTASNSWEIEPNNTFGAATPLNLNSGIYGTLIHAGLDPDIDYYSFEIKEASALKITFSHQKFTENYEGFIITLYNEKKNPVTSFASAWSDASVSKNVSLAQGKYYVAVDTGLRFNNCRYSLKIES
ncbi:MAG: hypothetical protein FWF08_06845 [Oscillospiraceae bacterium]|nr:hypothetical protein [Oscillospiraceae bacterium]